MCETKILYTKWHIEYLLHLSNWSPEAFEGQEDQPDIGLLQGPPAGHRSFENILSRCQKEVFDHTLSFHPIAAFILALWRSQRPPRPHILFLVKWFLLTSGSTPDGPWRCPAPPGPSRGPQRSQGHFLFLSLKPYNMGVYGFLLTSGLMPDVSWRCLNPSRSRALRYHFFRYRYDTDTFLIYKFDTDTILILSWSEISILILILIPSRAKNWYRYWYWYFHRKLWY